MTTQTDFTELDLPESTEDSDLQSQEVSIQVEKLSERQRQITAHIHIPQAVEKVWQILTDYETLPDFIPSLAKSCRIDHPDGGIRLEQVGAQKLLNINFCARVILDVEEIFPQFIKFQMVEGDFKGFKGHWQLEPYSLADNQGTNLCYMIQVWPKLTMPISIIERRLHKDMQVNLLAVRQRVCNLVN
ncbi:cyclase/dehydrase [Richelia sinica FACHB-800]|uniref:Cyclase/dehydrase n=1 Tax=Richelia sinica FACHB-800 TaxID=1357546 RepID=A0A975Y470_9NOST|nr:SRPBCC family protein [Richelia sinica]MBD2663572.1 SRPBCC family protein [Richelia sinica FACHB-800]QXE22874.1 cyclase/dehydrase [Richelia sinica FACHB-800]